MAKPRIRLKADVGGAMPALRAVGGIVGAAGGLGGGAFQGASTTNRDVAGWNASAGSADSDLLPDLPELIYRNRDIHRNNGLAHSIVRTSIDNIVGSGLRLSSQPDYLALGQTKEWADKWSAQYESLFHEWWWSTACHAGDTLTGDMLTEQVMFSKFNNGGSLTLPLWLPKRGDGFATKLQTVEIDRLSNPNFAPNTPTLRGGIEYDDFGVPIAYHIRKGHPGDVFFMLPNANAWTWERIERRTKWGRLRVIHDFDSDRADQTRGVPLLAAVLSQFKNLDRYQKAEIQAAIWNACLMGAIYTPLEHDEIVELFKNNEEGYIQARRDHAIGMKAGTLATLFPGDKLEPMLPARPASQYGVFCENVERIIAAGADMPLELAKKDFSKSNYSNTRAAMAEFYRSVTRRRDRLGAGWLDPINGLFMEEMVNAGRIEAPRFYEFRRAYQRCQWIGPPRGYVDKVKEAMGDMIALDGGLTTLQKLCAEQGGHWKENLDQRAVEIAYAKEKGVPQIVSGRATLVPENAADAPGEPTPGSGAPNGGAGAASFEYRLSGAAPVPV